MIRRAFTMRLKPGGLAEYKRHHDGIWQELVDEIERQGIAQITIFERDPVLFLYSEIRDEAAYMVCGLWMIIGLYIDGWSHQVDKPETFFTPFTWSDLFTTELV